MAESAWQEELKGLGSFPAVFEAVLANSLNKKGVTIGLSSPAS